VITSLIHLRLHFQLLLAPVFLWGWLLAGGGLASGVIVGFAAFHVFLYSGATAFNSYYDRDVGPVGGLLQPPRVLPTLLPFSLAVQAVGWLLAGLVNVPFWLLYGVFVVLSTAYSHPRIRLKAHAFASLIVVGLGQGGLAFLAAWAATRGELGSVWSAEGVCGALAAVLFILALYPISQLYQVGEDAARGDRTLAVIWSARACFSFSIACAAAGGLLMLLVVLRRFGLLDALVVGLGLLLQVGVLAAWSRRFDPRQTLHAYRGVMRFTAISAGMLGAYLVTRLLLPGA
jgi:1,4-dihydroxy-2-naphthoate octaprenyltransferase